MKRHLADLRWVCANKHEDVAPFLLRTRVERSLYGVLVEFCELIFGARPAGLTEAHIRDFIAEHKSLEQDEPAGVALSIARVFERFTYLSDTSNWSNDGQDPRIEMCRDDILRLCAHVESISTACRAANEGK
jgi:hypothetical protein